MTTQITIPEITLKEGETLDISIGLSITAVKSGGGGGPASWTWDATRIPTDYAIEGLFVLNNGGATPNRVMLSALPIVERTYWEILNGGNTFNGQIGLVGAEHLDDFNAGRPGTFGVGIFAGSGDVEGAGTVAAKTPSYVGQTAMFVYDPATKGVWYGVNGAWIGANPDTDPADIIASSIEQEAHVAVYMNRSGAAAGHTMRTASTNVYTPPAGCAVFAD